MGVIDVSKLEYRKNVGMVLINTKGNIFAGKRIDNNTDAWQMPQGGIDDGETPEVAAFRELSEETGIHRNKARLIGATAGWLSYDIPLELIPKLWNGQYRGQEQKWFLLKLNKDNCEIKLDNEDFPEFDKYEWVSYWQPIDRIVDFKREAYRKALSELRFLI